MPKTPYTIKTYSGEEQLIIGETNLGKGKFDDEERVYPIYAIPSRLGNPYYGAGNKNKDGVELCRRCGSLKSKISQRTGEGYCDRLCWTLLDREDKKRIDALIYHTFGLEMVKVNKTTDRGEMYQSYPDIPDEFYLNKNKEEGKQLVLLIRNYPEKLKEMLEEFNIKFRKQI